MNAQGGESGVTRVLTTPQFLRLRDLLTDFCGLSLSEDNRSRLARVVDGRMRRCSIPEVDAYTDRLAADRGADGELSRLVDEVTNNETYFFREEFQLEALAGEILPELVARVRRRRRMNVWSAGCSSGEEPLTLAMLLLESAHWAETLAGLEVRILGTDVSRRMIRRAREGRYGPSSFKGLTPARRREIQRRFFERDGERYVARPEVRQLVSYLHLNLLDRDGAALFGEMDVILCRNVLMYFPAPLRLRVIQGFYRKLAPRGYLLLGHSENLLGMETPYEAMRLRGSLVYRKPARRRAGFGEEWGA